MPSGEHTITTPLPAMAAHGCYGFGTLDTDGTLTIYLHDAATPAQAAAAAATIRARATTGRRHDAQLDTGPVD